MESRCNERTERKGCLVGQLTTEYIAPHHTTSHHDLTKGGEVHGPRGSRRSRVKKQFELDWILDATVARAVKRGSGSLAKVNAQRLTVVLVQVLQYQLWVCVLTPKPFFCFFIQKEMRNVILIVHEKEGKKKAPILNEHIRCQVIWTFVFPEYSVQLLHRYGGTECVA